MVFVEVRGVTCVDLRGLVSLAKWLGSPRASMGTAPSARLRRS
jgi:hypothetical protein